MNNWTEKLNKLRISLDDTEIYDFIVVGSGPASFSFFATHWFRANLMQIYL